MEKSFKLVKVGLALQAIARTEVELAMVFDRFGTGFRGFIHRYPPAVWRIEHALNNFPCRDEAVWEEILERMRRIQGETAKVDALLKRVSKSFPRNTTKEPQ